MRMKLITFRRLQIIAVTCACAYSLSAFSVQASTTIQGCQIYPDTNPWNRDVSADPLDPNSANYIAYISAGGKTMVHPDFGSNFGIPFVVVSGTQPMVPIAFTVSPDESDPAPYPIPSNAPVEGNGAPGDRHVLVLDKDNALLYEMYNSAFTNPGWSCDNGAVFDLKSNTLRPDGFTSADAAGLPVLAGLPRYAETNAGVITHALRFTVRATAKSFIHPATHYASTTANPNAPPMGLRLRLKASYSLAGMTGQSLVIATALKKYGMIVADNGSDWYISGEQNASWNDTDINQLKTIPGNMFEVVQSGSPISVSSSPQPPPTITTPPANQTVGVGQAATFTVVANGTGTIQYQWQKNGAAINGARIATYTTPPAAAGDNGSTFNVVVTSLGGTVTSASATLTVSGSGTAPSITTQPVNQTVTVGQTATFSVVASGTAPLTYQWLKNNGAIGGATSATYTTTPTAITDNGATFKCTVTNSVNSATSNAATLTVTAAPVKPTITTQPASQSVTAGQTATFSVAASGTSPLSYQWQKNSFNIGGATSASYTTPATTLAGSGSAFQCVVTNSVGSVTSNAATLTVNAPPQPVLTTISISPASATVKAGQTQQFSATGIDQFGAALIPQPALSWTVSGGGTIGAAGLFTATSGGTFTVTAASGAVRGSTPFKVTAPTITSPPGPGNPNVTAGNPVNFNAGAADPNGGTVTYVWNFGDGSTATGGSVTHTFSAPGNYNVTVTISDSTGDVTTTTIPITVSAAAQPPPPVAIAMSVSKLQGAASFKSGGHDACSISGVIPKLPFGFNPTGQALSLSIGGASASFTLDKNGRGRAAQGRAGTIALKLKPTKRDPKTKKPVFQGGDVQFTASIRNGAWAKIWGLDPNATASKAPMSMPATVQLAGSTYVATVAVTYSSKTHVSGKFKK